MINFKKTQVWPPSDTGTDRIWFCGKHLIWLNLWSKIFSVCDEKFRYQSWGLHSLIHALMVNPRIIALIVYIPKTWSSVWMAVEKGEHWLGSPSQWSAASVETDACLVGGWLRLAGTLGVLEMWGEKIHKQKAKKRIFDDLVWTKSNATFNTYPSSPRQTLEKCRLSKTWTYWSCSAKAPPVNQTDLTTRRR